MDNKMTALNETELENVDGGLVIALCLGGLISMIAVATGGAAVAVHLRDKNKN